MEHEQRKPQPEREPDPGPWRADEHVGDIYEIDMPSEIDNSREALDETAPQIWVGSLSDYNNGLLHGDWIAASQDIDGLHQAIQRILAASPWAAKTGERAEEWGIFDYENFGALRIGEYEDLSWVSAVARGISQHGLAFAAWADVMQDEDALTGFQDAYLGHYTSREDYAAQLVDDLGYNQILDDTLPEHLRRYVEIDTASLGQDMVFGGDIHILPANDGGVWIFDAHV